MLAQRRERIKPHELVVDMARVAHDHATVGESRKKAREEGGEVGVRAEIVGAGECRIDRDVERARPAAKPATEQIDHEALAITQSREQRQGAAALAHPGLRSTALDGGEHLGAHLGKQLHVLVTIDEIRRYLNADSLGYLSQDGMVQATGLPKQSFCMACYDGDYPVPYDPMVDKHIMERRRSRTEGLLPAIEHAEKQSRLFET